MSGYKKTTGKKYEEETYECSECGNKILSSELSGETKCFCGGDLVAFQRTLSSLNQEIKNEEDYE